MRMMFSNLNWMLNVAMMIMSYGLQKANKPVWVCVTQNNVNWSTVGWLSYDKLNHYEIY